MLRLVLKVLVPLTSVFAMSVFADVASAISITPPPSLNLNGSDINSGQFVLFSASTFGVETGPAGNSGTTSVTTFADDFGIDVSFSPPVDSEPQFLFSLPSDNVEVLQLAGAFITTDPDVGVAPFIATIFDSSGAPLSDDEAFTLFLPNLTATTTTPTLGFQITDVGSSNALSDNVDSFSSILPLITPNLDTGAVDISFVNDPTLVSQFQSHGTVTVPEPMTLLGSMLVLGFGLLFKLRRSRLSS